MKLTFTLISTLFFSITFAQWTRVEQLPSSDIFTVYHKDNILYAGGRSIIYISMDKGQTWRSTAIPELSLVNNIIVYKNDLYAAGPNTGVSKSSDGGLTWQRINEGIFPDVSDFCEFRGDLYASTYGSSVFKLNPATGNSWLPFSNGLSSLSANITSIAGNNNALVAGTLANGIYDYLPENSTTWEERLLSGQLSPNEGAYDITNGHDTLFYSTQAGKFYMSTNNGLTWNRIGSRINSLFSPLLNAKEALLTSAYFFDGANFNTAFLYIKKDSLQNPFINFSIVINHFTYRIDIFDNKLWDASDRGLFFMELSKLPGISSADSIGLDVLPVRFIQFNARCENEKVLLTWKTAQEQNSSHFEIERSEDGSHWTVIGRISAAGNSNIERSYSFTDNDPQNSFYRIAEYDLDGRSQYTSIRRSSCNTLSTFNAWPNPVHDKLFVTLKMDNTSRVVIKLFDSKGSLIKMQEATASQGNNQLNVDMSSLANGVYSLSIDSGNGKLRKTIQVIKQ